MKNFIGLISQYKIEIGLIIISTVIFVLACLLACFFTDNKIILIIIVVLSLISVIKLYKHMKWFLVFLHPYSRSKKWCNILYLSNDNKIYMQKKYLTNVDDLYKDFNDIIAYAKENQIFLIKTFTHSVVLISILHQYTDLNLAKSNLESSNISTGKQRLYKAKFGYLIVTGLGEYINNCNRYNTNNNIPKLKLLLEKKDHYNLTFQRNKYKIYLFSRSVTASAFLFA